MKSDAGWGWALAGKHPVVKDYIRIGQGSSLMDDFSRWVEGGYPRVKPAATPHSWRFFARGRRRGELSCGLIRDSRDGAGRPFPLLIMGWGVLAGWEEDWVHLPYSLDALWERIEFVCTRRVFDLEELKSEVLRLGGPSPVAGLWMPGGSAVRDGIPQHRGMAAARLPGTADHLDEIVELLLRMDKPGTAEPEAVFMGGPPEPSYVAVFFRPLVADDFATLWCMEQGNGI